MYLRRLVAILAMLACCGCHGPLAVRRQPVIYNPFPQLSRIAVAPFFNLSTEPTVDGREFALAYFSEMQAIGGYEVLPIGVVETTLQEQGLDLSSPDQARKLAEILGVDAVVIGAVTDFSPYNPPRCAMQIEWYAANSSFKKSRLGTALPWGTPGEELIPQKLRRASEFALARAQLSAESAHGPRRRRASKLGNSNRRRTGRRDRRRLRRHRRA